VRAVLIDKFEMAVLTHDECVTAGDERFLEYEVLVGRTADGCGIAPQGKGVLTVDVDVLEDWQCWDGHQADSKLTIPVV
jgi:hypothetical protein